MTPEQITILILIIVTPTLIVLGLLFLLLAVAGQVLTNDDDHTSLGTALGHVCGSMAILVISLSGFFIMRLRVGPSPEPLEPAWLDATLRAVLGVSAIWCLVAGLFAFLHLIQRFRKPPKDAYEINQAAVFGTLAKAMPIIVSCELGIIRHTTEEFDNLVGAVPGELIGRPLETIMPERYVAGHAHGMQRYIATREPHIIGTVVNIDMLRRDGQEIPVYLALNTTDTDGKPWFVASIWPKPRVEPETLISTFSDATAETINHTASDVEEVKNDVKTLRKHADAADVRADAADVRADAAEARADAMDKEQ